MNRVARKRFLSDREGTIAPLFGLSLLGFMFVVGIAIDGSRAYQASTEVTTALDSAAMAAAQEMRNNSVATDAELQSLAASYFSANLETTGGVGIVFDQLTLSSDRSNGSVTLTVDTKLPTTFSSLLGVSEIDIPKSATAIDGTREIELSMMLDLSGSMAGSRISELKVAAKELVRIILGANEMGAKNRIAIAPYSTSVNLGDYARKAKGDDGLNSCVTERTGANAFTDKGPTGGLFNSDANSCPASAVMPLTDNKSQLESHISAMQAGGWTAGHLGIAWSWYLVSPQWASVWPEASTPNSYSSDVMKVAIVMTDGEFNKSYEPQNGDSEQQSKKLCDGMKAAGITIYSVAFQAPASALPILQYCASSNNHYFDAANGENLLQSFREIARRLSLLRLTN
ncbi:MAG: pilus assembly protein TadG-related protein [Gammaproteobacteria bacterium]|nr:pilus assembly protein TadG-related protein [Gammaproteobacteria bacterium]